MSEESEASPAEAGHSAAAGRPSLGTLRSLRHRNYRLLWLGSLVSHSGDTMDQVALNWLVLVMTDSPLYLGLFNLTRAVPLLALGLVAGVIVDRVERRRLLMITQAAAMALAFALAVLVSSGAAQIWHIFVLGVLRGTVMSFNAPARQTIISDLVPRSDLANAVALNSATMQITRILGPALGGILIASVGPSSPFYVNGVSFLAVLYTLYAMVLPGAVGPARQTSMWHELGEGLAYIRGNHTILALMTLFMVPMFLGQPYMTMLTVFARDVLGIGPMGLGLLTAGSAVGSVSGALVLASLGDYQRKGALMLKALFGFGAILLFFSLSSWPVVSILLVTGVGAMSTIYAASNNTMIQLLAPDNLRGRLLSVMTLERGLVPLGTAMAGASAAAAGAPLAMGAMASLIAVLALVARRAVPSLSDLK